MSRPTITPTSSDLSLLGVAALAMVILSTCAAPDGGAATPGGEQEALDPAPQSRLRDSAEPTGGSDERQEAGTGQVQLTPDQVRRLEIQTEVAKPGSARSSISRPARLQFDLNRHAFIGPRVAAKVVRVTADLGQSVEPGQVVAIMSSVELGRAATRYLAQRSRLATERAAYLREQELTADKISSEAAMLEAKARFHEAEAEFMADSETLRLLGLNRQTIEALRLGSEAPLSRFDLKSPIRGVVQKRDLAIGDSVGPDETPIHVTDPTRLWLMIDAQEQDLPLLQSGQTVTLTFRSLPGRVFRGEVDWISQELDQKTRTLPVRAIVLNQDLTLRAGMFGTAAIHTDDLVRDAVVPVGAVQSIGSQSVVFVAGDDDGVFELRSVVTGTEDESSGFVEVLSGLEPGEKVVAHGAFELKSIHMAASLDAAQDD